MTKSSGIFKKPDYSHLIKEAENSITPQPIKAPDFSLPDLVLPEGIRLSGEEQLQFQFANAMLIDRREYVKACHEALHVHAARNVDPLAAAERFAEAYAEFHRLLLIRDFTIGFFQMRHEMRTLEQEIAKLQITAIENPLLREHLETLKRSADELRSQIKDKEELLASYREKMKSTQAETKRFQRTNKEVADIIYNATKNHSACSPLRWSESKISRLNRGCKNGGLGKDGYPGNTATFEAIVMWAIQMGQRQEAKEEAADNNRQERFERSIVSLSPEMLEKCQADSGCESSIYYDEANDD